jgi:hypothetical protein
MDNRDEQAKRPATPKKYVSPRLVFLGAVRDLTAGSAGSATEMVFLQKNPGM